MWGIRVASGTPAASAARVGASVRMSETTTAGSSRSISGSSARAASAAWRPSSVSGSGGGKVRYSSAAAKPSPAPSTAARRSSQVSTVSSCPRRASPRPSEIAGKTWPGSPKAATRTRTLGGGVDLAGAGEDDLRDVAVGGDPEQVADRLADIRRLNHRLGRDRALDEVGHRGVDEGGGERRAGDPLFAHLALGGGAEVDQRGLGRAVDREPGLAPFAGDRGGVDDQRLAVLEARLSQHRHRFARAEDGRAQVHR